MPIVSWSHSKIVDYEKCNFLAYLKHDAKIPEPARPLPEGKLEHANDRGTRVHDGLEACVRGKGPMPVEARKFELEVTKLQTLFTQGAVSLEGEWGMDRDWNPAEWRAAWLRLKLDALVHLSPTEAVAIDYKTGKKFGNEIKHGEQLQLYQLVTFLRYPMLETVHTELWYLDADDITQKTFTRDQGLRFKRNWDQRGNKLTTATVFPPNPNKFSCQWCMYGPRGSGHCKVGV